MGDTGANMAHWSAGLYGGGGEATAAATAGGGSVSSPTSGGSGGGGGSSPTRAGQHQPGVEGGRVGKPARRRSRASRRAPVTLLNTDTSNFRAMVQQFTGIPAVPAGPYGHGGPGGGGPVISFGGAGAGGGEYGGALVRPSPTSAVMSFDHLAAGAARGPAPSSLQAQHHHHQLFRPQHHQYGGHGGDVGGGYGGGLHGGDMSSSSPFFHHGFDSSAEDRMLLQSMQAAQMMPSRPASTANNGNGYNFG